MGRNTMASKGLKIKKILLETKLKIVKEIYFFEMS